MVIGRLFGSVLAITFGLGILVGYPPAKAQNLLQDAFIELAKKVNPGVVNISTEYQIKNRMFQDPFFEILEEFYGFRLQPRMKPLTSLGTGFVIREDGLIITNHHVIAGADKVQVQFEKEGKYHDAQVVGSDDRADIALLKIKGGTFPTLKLGDSDKVQVGEWVAAFGNPFGNGHTMTKGIISAIGRDISEINKYPLLQTDAPINPGNSGGPLVNLKGEVIGVNNAVAARAQGIGFAIPINAVKRIIPDLEKHGSIKRGYLGIAMYDLDPRIRMSLGIKEDIEGVIIAEVEAGSPAQIGGLKPYDIIYEFNGRKITNSQQLRDAVADAEIGREVEIKLYRDGKSRTLRLKVGDRPSGFSRLKQKLLGPTVTDRSLINQGLVVGEITDEIRQELQIPTSVNGIYVVQVVPGSRAARSGLMNQDIIMDVNKKPITSASALTKELNRRGPHNLRVYRQGTILFLSW